MQYALEHGMINMSYVQEQIDMNKRKELLEKHPYKIWEGKDGNWFTYFPNDGGSRVLKKRKSKALIEDTVCEFWKEKSENPTIEKIFYEWISKKLDYKEITKGSADRYEIDYQRFFVDSGFSKRHIKQIEPDDIEDFIRTQIAQHQRTGKKAGESLPIINHKEFFRGH